MGRRLPPLSALIPICFLLVVGGIWKWRDVENHRPLPIMLRLYPKGGLARYEPRNGCLLGAFVDLDPSLTETFKDSNGKVHRLPGQFEEIVGKKHAIYFFYLGYGRPAPLDWIKRLGQDHRFVHIALEPNGGLDRVRDDAYLNRFASDLNRSGVPIFLRFGSEMNGTWTPYHDNPAQYIEKFRLVSRIMHERAPNVAMLWCPYTTPKRIIPDYYPGDDAVDWVGVNMYNVTYFDQDLRKPAMKIKPVDMLDNVYRLYCDHKPIMIGEYGTTHYSAIENKTYEGYAVRNITSLYEALQTSHMRAKAINYFNNNNMLLSHRKNNDYTVQSSERLLKAYQDAIEPDYFLSDQGLAPWRPINGDTMPHQWTLDQPTDIGFNDENSLIKKVRIFRDQQRVSELTVGAAHNVTLNPQQLNQGTSSYQFLMVDGNDIVRASAESTITVVH